MDKTYKFDYVAGEYSIVIEGSLEELYNELDKLLDYYRNEMEAFTYNDMNRTIEELEDAGFKVTKND